MATNPFNIDAGANADGESRQRPLTRWLPVLMYHRVVDHVVGADPYHLSISAADFEAQLAYLRREGYQSIALDQVPIAVNDASTWKKLFATSFDDGYLDNYTHAFPILQKYGFVATIMLVSEFIGGRNIWDADKAEPAPLLSVEHIREMERYGIHFGAHTARHLSLPDVGIEEARRELVGCKEKLEQILDHEVSTLAYPYGRSTPNVCRVAQEAGFVAAFGVEHWTKSMFNFGRIDAAACPGNTLQWRLKVSGAYLRLRENNFLRMLHLLPNRLRSLRARDVYVQWRQNPWHKALSPWRKYLS